MGTPVWEAKGSLLEATTGTPSVAVPTGVAVGKIVTVSMFLDGAVATVTGKPVGFTECENSPVLISAGAGSHSINTFWKRATGNDTGTYDFTLSGSTFVAAYAEVFNECKETGSPWEASPATATQAASTVDTPSVSLTTNGPNRLIVWRATSWSGGTWTPPSGFDERHDGGFGVITNATKELLVAGPTGSTVGTVTVPDKHTVWMGALIGKVPAVANQSISDKARANMLVALGYTADQAKSKTNVDLMREVVAAGGLGLLTVDSATAAVHYWRYLKIVRDT